MIRNHKIGFNKFYTKCVIKKPNQIIPATYNTGVASVAVAKIQSLLALS